MPGHPIKGDRAMFFRNVALYLFCTLFDGNKEESSEAQHNLAGLHWGIDRFRLADDLIFKCCSFGFAEMLQIGADPRAFYPFDQCFVILKPVIIFCFPDIEGGRAF